MRVPFIVYADFESFTSQMSTCQPNPDNSYATPSSTRNTSQVDIFDDTLYSQEPDTFVKEFNDDDVAQIL